MSIPSPQLNNLLSHPEQLRIIGTKARTLREQKKMSRKELSSLSGVSVATIVRFERDGTGTLSVMLKIAGALKALHTFEGLFTTEHFKTLDEFERAKR